MIINGWRYSSPPYDSLAALSERGHGDRGLLGAGVGAPMVADRPAGGQEQLRRDSRVDERRISQSVMNLRSTDSRPAPNNPSALCTGRGSRLKRTTFHRCGRVARSGCSNTHGDVARSPLRQSEHHESNRYHQRFRREPPSGSREPVTGAGQAPGSALSADSLELGLTVAIAVRVIVTNHHE